MKTFTQIYIMAVFAVKHRESVIHKEIRPHIHALLAKLLNEHGKGSKTICVGGTNDHVHILFSLSPNIALSDLLREVKSRCSRYINEARLFGGATFEWQAGYGAFSYSQSTLSNVVEYIKNQEEHHRYKPFSEELTTLLNMYGISVDSRDLPHDLG